MLVFTTMKTEHVERLDAALYRPHAKTELRDVASAAEHHASNLHSSYIHSSAAEEMLASISPPFPKKVHVSQFISDCYILALCLPDTDLYHECALYEIAHDLR